MTTTTARRTRIPTWLAAVVPIAVIGVLIGVFVAFNPIRSLRSTPPVEAIAFERVVFREGTIEVHIRNDGPDPVTVSQVTVNDSYRDFDASRTRLGRLETATITIPYPWDEGLPINIGLVTSTGLVLEHDVAAAALTPAVDLSTLVTYALLGLYIGVVPVAVGLLWYRSLQSASRTWLTFFLAFTIGLLLFLLVDTVAEGLELAGETASALNGLGLFTMGALIAVGGLLLLDARLKGSGGGQRERGAAGALVLTYLVAAGIGLHNLGEGLAVGAALTTGEIALGTFLVVGFALHNTTEGLAIVAPLGRHDRPALIHFAWLGLLAGGPAIIGAWLGGFAFSPAIASLAFGVAAGAIAQVVWQIGRSTTAESSAAPTPAALGIFAGFAFMYLTGLLTG